MYSEIFYLFILTLPALLANASPIIFAKLNILNQLNKPVDFGKTFRKKRLFGKNKTFRGYFSGILTSILVSIILYFFAKNHLISIPFLNSFNSFVFFGFISGLSAILGDSIESFFKRQFNIAPGKPFIPFDQTDYLISFLLFTNFLAHWNMKEIIIILSFGLVLNPIANTIAYFLGIKKTFW